MLTKTFPLKDAGFEKIAADDDALALINRFTLRPLSADEVYIRRMVVANDQLDRDHEHFSPEVLRHFAGTLPGKSFLVGHQHGSAPIGRFFHAEVLPSSPYVPVGAELVSAPKMNQEQAPGEHIRREGADSPTLPSAGAVEESTRLKSQPSGLSDSRLNLVASFYTVKTADNEGFRQQIDGGVYSYVSIGFRCEKLVCPHYPGKSYDGSAASGTWQGQAEALEASLVYLGAQFGAQFVKSPAAGHPSPESKSQRVQASGPEAPRLPDSQTPRLSDSPWDWDWKTNADAIIEALGWHGLELACAYKDSAADPQSKAAYKLPHHKLVYGEPSRTVDGHLSLFYRGVVAAMSALLGGRGGVDIPQEKRRSVYDHLAAHYRQFDQEPPEFKSVATSDLPVGAELACPEFISGVSALEMKSGRRAGEHTSCSPTLGGPTAAVEESAGLKTQDPRLKALEVLLEQKERRIDKLSELAEEAKALRSDLISQILSRASLVGLPSLLDPQSLSDLPLARLKSLLSDLSREFDRKFPPRPLTTNPNSGLSTLDSRPSTLNSKTDLSPFHLPKT